MSAMPASVAEFLKGKRIVVAGVSRDPKQTANIVYKKLRDAGYEAIPVNPNAEEVEGVECYRGLASVPGGIDGVVAVTHPRVAADLVQQCAERGVKRLWFHRLMGAGSLSTEAVGMCRERGIACIAGGCPLMYVEPVDVGHRCFRWLLGWNHRLSG